MPQQFEDLKMNMQNAQQAFKNGMNTLRSDYEKDVEEKAGKMSLTLLNDEPADFSLFYCLSETLEQCERVINEKPGREIALVKTKLQEAFFWLKLAK